MAHFPFSVTKPTMDHGGVNYDPSTKSGQAHFFSRTRKRHAHLFIKKEEKRIQNGSVQEDPHYGGRKQRNKNTSINKRNQKLLRPRIGVVKRSKFVAPPNTHRSLSSSVLLMASLRQGERPSKTQAFWCFHNIQRSRLISEFSPFLAIPCN
jgi:hypothetical protein